MKAPRSGPRLWIIAFAGFFLLHAAWAFAAPYGGPPDEQAHALRAAAVAHGQLFGSVDGTKFETPRSLFRWHCFEMQVEVPADCVPEPGGDTTTTLHTSSAANYNPVYYVVTGWPLGIWPNWTGIILARLLNGAAMAALLASALVSAARWISNRGVLTGLVVAITPMTVSLGGAINPNGLEIAAGVALFAGLIPLLLDRRDGVHRGALALVAISASVLVTPRPLGVLWLAVILVSVAVGTSRAHLVALARRRAVRWWVGLMALSAVAALAWTQLAHPLQVTSAPPGQAGTKEILRVAIFDVWPNVANQMVGVTGWSEVLQPRLIYVAWFMAIGLLVVGGFTLGGRADKWRILVLSASSFVPLLGAEILLVNQTGWFNQGRYFLAGAVGLPMLGGYAMARSGIAAEKFATMTRTLALFLLPIQLVCLGYTMCRWESGLRSINPLNGSWHPPLGPVLPLVLGLLGVLILGAVYWWASRGPAAGSPIGSGEQGSSVLERQAPDPDPEPAEPMSRPAHQPAFATTR